MKKKDIELLETWDNDTDRVYDFIYIVPTRKKYNDYYGAWYIGRIGDIYKKIDFYDCGSVSDRVNGYKNINFDFQDMYGGIKIWTNHGKLTYRGYGDITILPKQ